MNPKTRRQLANILLFAKRAQARTCGSRIFAITQEPLSQLAQNLEIILSDEV